MTLVLSPQQTVADDEPPITIRASNDRYIAGSKLRSVLDAPLTAEWDATEFRDLVRRLGDNEQFAILIDRRINPNRLVGARWMALPLRDGFAEVAQRGRARPAFLDGLVYFGPPTASQRLRTVVEIRRAELTKLGGNRVTAMKTPISLTWADLAQPRALVEAVAEHYKVTIDGLDELPYDCWAGAVLPQVDAVEAFALLLIQFDRTWEWQDGGRRLKLVPLPDTVSVNRKYRPKGKLDATIAAWREEYPDLVVSTKGNELSVDATVEQHEQLAQWLNPTTKPQPRGVTPIERREITLRLRQVSYRALMKKFEESQVVFDYDPAALAERGINLDQTIEEYEAKRQSGREFFRAVFEPLGLKVEIDGLTVRLRPKPE